MLENPIIKNDFPVDDAQSIANDILSRETEPFESVPATNTTDMMFISSHFELKTEEINANHKYIIDVNNEIIEDDFVIVSKEEVHANNLIESFNSTLKIKSTLNSNEQEDKKDENSDNNGSDINEYEFIDYPQDCEKI